MGAGQDPDSYREVQIQNFAERDYEMMMDTICSTSGRIMAPLLLLIAIADAVGTGEAHRCFTVNGDGGTLGKLRFFYIFFFFSHPAPHPRWYRVRSVCLITNEQGRIALQCAAS